FPPVFVLLMYPPFFRNRDRIEIRIYISINTIRMKAENRQLLVVTHLSQLLDIVTGFGGFLVPLILWLTQRDSIMDMDENGRSIVNFRLSMFLYILICIPLILLLGLGIMGIIAIAVLSLVFPIINAVKVSNGEKPYYPLSIKFL